MNTEIENLYKMLYSTDQETMLLAVDIIKEEVNYKWMYYQAIDDKHFLTQYSISFFNRHGIFDQRIIILHRIRFIFYELYIKNNGRFN